MGKFREICKRLILCLRRLPVHAGKKLTAFRRGRGTIKYAFFYRYVSYFLFAQSLVALGIGLSMLWPYSENPFFDFHVTTDLPGLGAEKGDVCSADKTSLFKFWHGLQNYSVLAQLMFCQSVIFFASSVLMFLLSMGYRHFAYVERESFANVSFKTKWLGWFVKKFPTVLKLTYIVMFIFLVVPFYLFIIGSTCEVRVPAIQNIEKIKNCRRWLFECVGDTALFGQQFECSKVENYRMFPPEPCGRKTHDSKQCVFPISQDMNAKAADICDGSGIKDHENFGPFPICPLCTVQRTDRNSKVYVEDYLQTYQGELKKLGHFHKSAGSIFNEGAAGGPASAHSCPAESYLFTDFFQYRATSAAPPPTAEGEDGSGSIAAEQARKNSGISKQLARLKSAKLKPQLASSDSTSRPRFPGVAGVNYRSMTVDETSLFCDESGAFHKAYKKAMFLMHQGSYVGRVLYGWTFCAFISFLAVRLIGWYIHIIVVEDPSFFTPAQGGIIRRSFHSFFKNIGL